MPAALAILSSLVWGASDFLGGTVARRLPALAVVGVSQLCALLVAAPVVLLLGAPGDPRGWLPWAVGAGVLSVVSLGAFYAALAVGTMGVVAPIAATGVVVPVVIGLVGGDRPAPVQLAGIALAIGGVVLASGPELRGVEEGRAAGGARALVLAALAALGFGLLLWLVARGAAYSVGMTILTQRTTSVLLVGLVALATRSVGGVRGRDLPVLALVGWGDAVAMVLYAVASRSGLLSVVAVLGSLYPVVTVLLARWLHHERLARVQNLGVVAALLGVVLIAAG